MMLNRDALETCRDYADWVAEHRQQLPSWFPVDSAREAFEATYPFHPTVLSVFERKWQALPRFQQTRGVLRLLALWVSQRLSRGLPRARTSDPLIGLGTAPLDDPAVPRRRSSSSWASQRLEGAVTTDICGKKDSHAMRLDDEAVDTIQKARLHRKVGHGHLLRVQRRPGAGPRPPCPRSAWPWPSRTWTSATSRPVLEDALRTSCYYLHGRAATATASA